MGRQQIHSPTKKTFFIPVTYPYISTKTIMQTYHPTSQNQNQNKNYATVRFRQGNKSINTPTRPLTQHFSFFYFCDKTKPVTTRQPTRPPPPPFHFPNPISKIKIKSRPPSDFDCTNFSPPDKNHYANLPSHFPKNKIKIKSRPPSDFDCTNFSINPTFPIPTLRQNQPARPLTNPPDHTSASITFPNPKSKSK